jgi:hypothetical protein
MQEQLIMRSSLVAFSIVFFGLMLPNDVDAQQTKMFRIGFLSPAVSSAMAVRVDRFKRGLEEFGYVDGKNTIIEYRFAEGSEGRLNSLASELAPKVELIVAHGTQAAELSSERPQPCRSYASDVVMQCLSA